MLLSRTATNQMLKQAQAKSLKGNELILRYLQAFGITNPSLDEMPKAFDIEYLPEWKAFLKEIPKDATSPNQRALTTVLSFIRYCKLLKMDPFDATFSSKYKDPITKTAVLNLDKINLNLAQNNLETIANAVNKYLVKQGFSRYFRLERKQIELTIQNSHTYIVGAYVLQPLDDKASLDSILAKMEGILYTKDLPKALQPRTKLVGKKSVDQLEKASTLLPGISKLGFWLMLNSPIVEVLLTRAKDDKLVLKVLVKLGSKDNADKLVAKAIKLKLWKKFKII